MRLTLATLAVSLAAASASAAADGPPPAPTLALAPAAVAAVVQLPGSALPAQEVCDPQDLQGEVVCLLREVLCHHIPILACTA